MADAELRKRTTGQREAQHNGAEKKLAKTMARRKGRSKTVQWVGLGALVLGIVYWYTGIAGIRGGWKAVPAKNARIDPDYDVDIERRDAIVDAFRYAWSAYERDAMGYDNYHPIEKKGTELSKAGGIGYTIVDAIDTMQIMGLADEYKRARDWIAENLTFERDDSFNTFETTIRVLGGLLSAYHLSGNDPVLLEKAKDLGERILPAFQTRSGLPLPMVNLKRRTGVGEEWLKSMVSTAEAATLQLELKYLAHLTDEAEFWYKAERVMDVIKKADPEGGLVPIHMDADTGQYIPSEIRLGSRGDSYYEYLLKQYLQTNRTEDVYREMYEIAMTGIYDHLLHKGLHEKHLYTSELLVARDMYGQPVDWDISPKQDHLVCFLGGSLMLGAVTAGALIDNVSVPPHSSELSETGKRDWTVGYELIETCMDTYDTATGLSPEIVHFYVSDDERDPSENRHKDWYVKGMEDPLGPPSYDARYMLRPETVESLFIAFRLTGDHRYRDYGWKIFQAIEKHAKVETGGYVTVLDVNNVESAKEDKMESFFLSETLKYLYLLFSESSVIPLDRYVFNTEAHPLPKFAPNIRTGFS
ncbi:glycoside hydrolase family 47 protein [Coprinopsis marcescibilis]|uniref:alpha-1,2-Mannosidase n=1 Tax=Coprinopsis marcescibilis TaxID=230819 RepID=A0A5C3KU42_COPMA|nr:glycoside hydrolase family 47 protein [Coprinopsis marcescibilis]